MSYIREAYGMMRYLKNINIYYLKSSNMNIRRKLLIENAKIFEKKRQGSHGPEMINVLGLQLYIPPSVVSPLAFNDCQFFTQKVYDRLISLEKPIEKFLEIGTGSGITSIFLAHKFNCEIIATDINEEAVLACKINAIENGIKNKYFQCILGNLFDPIPLMKKFDTIYWNHPWINESPPKGDCLDLAAYDLCYQSLDAFFSQAHNYLSKNSGSEILLGTSSLADLEIIFDISERYKYSSSFIVRETQNLSIYSDLEIELFLISFKKCI